MKTILLIGADTSAFPLAGYEFRIISAQSCLDGLAQARAHTPNAIVYLVDDHAAPDNLLRDLDTDPALAAIPVIVAARQLTYDDIRGWMDAGADDCLSEDSLPGGLARAIHARLAKRAAIERQNDRTMDTLRYSISAAMPHEFRTALAGILGFSSMLREDCTSLETTEIRDMAGHIEKSARRMHRQVESYAWYARLRTQEITGEGSTITHGDTCHTPAEIIQSLAWQHAKTADRLGDLSVAIGNASVRVFAEYVEKIVGEVIDNAFKFSKQGTPISVSTSINGDYSVVVRDHGRGMTAEQINQLGAYMQFDRKIYEQQGAGMGLTIARGLAQLHGGTVTVESAPGKGTVVRVVLPLVIPSPD